LLKKYIKRNIWRVAVRPSYIYDARFLKVKPIGIKEVDRITDRKGQTRTLEATSELFDVRTLTFIRTTFSYVSLECYVHTLRISYVAAQKFEDSALTEDRRQFDSQTDGNIN
jgi:hypothetical protein